MVSDDQESSREGQSDKEKAKGCCWGWMDAIRPADLVQAKEGQEALYLLLSEAAEKQNLLIAPLVQTE